MSTQPPQQVEFNQRLAAQISIHREWSADEQRHLKKFAWQVTFRRIIACIIDYLSLALLGWAIIFIFGARLDAIGDGGFWIGLAITLAYFSYFHSRYGKGRTIGKLILGIEVHSVDGSRLDLIGAIIRFMPFLFARAAMHVVNTMNPLTAAFWGLLSFVFLIDLALVIFLFLHPQHRSIHDLLADSVVVRKNVPFEVRPASVRRPAIVMAAAVILVCSSAGALRWHLVNSAEWPHTVKLWSTLYDLPEISRPRLIPGMAIKEFFPKVQDSMIVMANAIGSESFFDAKKASDVAAHVGQALIASNALPVGVARIIVMLHGGFDIGLAHTMETRTFVLPVSREPGQQIIYKSTPGRSQKPKPVPTPEKK